MEELYHDLAMPARLKITLTQEEDDTLKNCVKSDVCQNEPVKDRVFNY